MAQRTPIRSILSAVPSKQASGETPKESRSQNQPAEQSRNVPDEPPRRERRRDTRRQRRQRPQEQTSQARSAGQRHSADKTPSQGTDLSVLQPGRRKNQQVSINSGPSQVGNAFEPASRPPLGKILPVSPAKRSIGDIKPYRPDSTPARSQKRTGPVSSINQRPSRTNASGAQPPAASRQPSKLNPQNSPSKTQSAAPQPSRQRRKGTPNQPQKSTSPLVYTTRMLIVGVGLGVIVGTLLSVFDPASRYPSLETNAASLVAESSASGQRNNLDASDLNRPDQSPAMQLSREIGPVKTQMQALVAQNTELSAGAFFVDLDTGAYVDLSGGATFAAASTIKVPILIAFFQDVDAGKIRLDEQMTMRKEQMAEGSGDMQYQPVGTKYTALETATKMIAISDNTATNMLIDRLGGALALNQRFQSWGLSATTIRNILPDLEGTNTTSPRDMANVMALVNQGKLVSLRSRDRLLAIMQGTVNNSLLPQGLEPGATIAHKTGDIGFLVGDVGIIDLPTGKRYIAAVMVKRPHNDERGSELIRQFSRIAYQYFSK